jgi:hypothetical protein
MLLAFSPTSSLAEFTNDALKIGDTHAILEQSKVRSLFGFFLKPDRNNYHDTRYSSTMATAIILCWGADDNVTPHILLGFNCANDVT